MQIERNPCQTPNVPPFSRKRIRIGRPWLSAGQNTVQVVAAQGHVDQPAWRDCDPLPHPFLRNRSRVSEWAMSIPLASEGGADSRSIHGRPIPTCPDRVSEADRYVGAKTLGAPDNGPPREACVVSAAPPRARPRNQRILETPPIPRCRNSSRRYASV